ncbi:related to protein-lysine N-methyltransferase [Ustilago trichophora]|uniref:Histone-lysine N-methyltransferase, H3 lysine-79 specific n=1 Tax=Ustilago trichophora TaxID=86804 RepID=A0A5C3EHB7_9BASI|nr:related to protein-lysine N-methyltransferase [Ustilago trichophora]
MINFFGGKAPPGSKSSSTSSTTRTVSATTSSPSTSSSTTANQPPLKKTKIASPAVTVVTTVKKKLAPPKPTEPRDPIAALSGYNSKNALPEEKRRRIIEERLATQRQKSIETSLEAQLRAPVKSSSKSKRASHSTSSAAKPKPKRPRKKVVDSDSDDLDDDQGFGGYGRSSRMGSSAPSTPRGSKRASVDPHPTTDSYQKLGREGVLPNYTVPRDILATTFSATQEAKEQREKPISSADIVISNIKSYGPYFHGLGDAPRAVLEYPGPGASEEFLLLVPKDADEYDPLMELLATVRAIVTHYLTPEQRKAFGALDSLQVSNNAGMILPSATNGASASTSAASNTVAALADTNGVNGTRAKSADLLDSEGSKASRRDELVGSDPTSQDAGSKTPEPHANGISHTAPVSPSSHTASTSTAAAPASGSVAKSVLVNNALVRLDSPAPTESSLFSDHSSNPTSSSTDPDSILRSFTKARNRRDGPLFMRALSRFNSALIVLRDSGALATNISSMGHSTGVPEGIWRLIQDQVYARVVGPRVEELGRYQAFSDNVYGELLPRFMSEIAQLTNLGPDKVFVDLGSGVGNLLIQTSLQTGSEAYGCEMMPIPAALASQQITEAQLRWAAWGLRGSDAVEAWQGDFGEHTGVRDVLKRADVVLVNNYAFLPKTNENLSLLFLDLPDGAQIVSLKPFVPPDFRLTQRTLSSPLAILRVTERLYTSGCVSWADGGGKYYIQTVDRSLVREFLELANSEANSARRGKGRGRGRGRDGSEDGATAAGSDLMVGQDVRRKRWKAAIEDDDEDEDDDDLV